MPNEPHTPTVRTIIIDPYPLSRFGLHTLLDREPEFDVIRSVASPRALARAPRVDVAVVQTDGGHDHSNLAVPVVEVRLHDAPHRVLAALRRQLGLLRVIDDRPRGDLTRRELEVVRLVADGQTDHEIADALFLSVRTVRSHLDRIRAKTGRRRRADLTRWFVERDED